MGWHTKDILRSIFLYHRVASNSVWLVVSLEQLSVPSEESRNYQGRNIGGWLVGWYALERLLARDV
jgi:hypothetical protein